ncbi:hypothetical protein [Haloferula sp. BvORR071]|uniref:hypothetical protein n=1 Tax=Haloferula sp. BvORR071 TaxID=1396141 RepID=UPI000556DAD3|nr:hypothetical protein [Haloferula sp. BvORR071]
MKSGFLDLLIGTTAWVVGKTALFGLATILGLLTGGAGLWAGTALGSGNFGFRAGDLPIFGYLTVVGAVLPQFLLMLIAGYRYVRSEEAGAREWLQLVALQAALLLICFALALPEGLLPQIVAWIVTGALFAGQVKIAARYSSFQLDRGVDALEKLKADNARRRLELNLKYGTVSSGADELGIFE